MFGWRLVHESTYNAFKNAAFVNSYDLAITEIYN